MTPIRYAPHREANTVGRWHYQLADRYSAAFYGFMRCEVIDAGPMMPRKRAEWLAVVACGLRVAVGALFLDGQMPVAT